MALETSDIFPVQKTGGGPGSVRQATIGALLSLASSASGFWERSSTTLSPVNSGDDLDDIGDISAVSATFSGDVSGDNAVFTGTLEADSIDGGEYAV